MAFISDNNDKLRVLQATPIERLIADHVAIKPKGREFVCICPFHDDHRPSMTIVPAKQIFKCFACGAGGDAFDFVMRYHQMSFREALEFLAERASIKLTARKRQAGDGAPADEAPGVSRQDLIAANQFAAEYFRAILRHAEHGAAARAVLARREVPEAMVERFGLGAAADKWDGLALTVAKHGKPVEPFIAAGLLRRRENGQGLYDGFRNRVMFPITDQLGRVIAFGARRINDEDEPKYLNSPDSAVFSKSQTLYALPLAVPAIRALAKDDHAGTVIVTEGYMDTIACHQAGIENAVATLGTALTPQNGRILSRLAKTVVLLFDGDAAGQKAADRAIEVLFGAPIDVKIATLSTLRGVVAKDPDELLKQPGGKDSLLALVRDATDALVYRFDRLRHSAKGLGLSAASALIDAEIERLVELGLADVSPLRHRKIVLALASIAGVNEPTLAAQIAEVTSRKRVSNRSASTPEPPTIRLQNDCQRVLACLLADPSLAADAPREALSSILSPANIAHPVLEKVAQSLDSMLQGGNASSTQAVLAALDDADARAAVTTLVAEIHRMISNEPSRLRLAFMDALARATRDTLVAQAKAAPSFAERIRLTQLAQEAQRRAHSAAS